MPSSSCGAGAAAASRTPPLRSRQRESVPLLERPLRVSHTVCAMGGGSSNQDPEAEEAADFADGAAGADIQGNVVSGLGVGERGGETARDDDDGIAQSTMAVVCRDTHPSATALADSAFVGSRGQMSASHAARTPTHCTRPALAHRAAAREQRAPRVVGDTAACVGSRNHSSGGAGKEASLEEGASSAVLGLHGHR